MHDNHLKVYEPVAEPMFGHYISGRAHWSEPGNYTSAGHTSATPGAYVTSQPRTGLGCYTATQL